MKRKPYIPISLYAWIMFEHFIFENMAVYVLFYLSFCFQYMPADNVTGTVASERMLQPLLSSKHDEINEMLMLILVSVGVSFWLQCCHHGWDKVTEWSGKHEN